MGELNTKTINLNGITVEELRNFLADIPGNVELCIEDDGGSGFVEGCTLEYMELTGIADDLTLTIEARSCYY